jgi:protein translocase SecG subunit
MIAFLTALQVLAAFILVTSVLLQPAKGDGAFAPSSQALTGNSAGTNFLFKTTMVCAAFLALSSLYMTWHKIKESKSSVIDQLAVPVTPDMAPAAAPTGSDSLPAQQKSPE